MPGKLLLVETDSNIKDLLRDLVAYGYVSRVVEIDLGDQPADLLAWAASVAGYHEDGDRVEDDCDLMRKAAAAIRGDA